MGSYTVKYTETVLRQLKKMDRHDAIYITSWISKNLIDCMDPRSKGKALSHDFSGACRYRIGNYRLIADIQDTELVILLLSVGHRKDIYK